MKTIFFTNILLLMLLTSGYGNNIQNLSPETKIKATKQINLSNDLCVLSSTKKKPLDTNIIKIDADTSDWASVPIVANSQLGDLKIVFDFDRVYFLLEKGDIDDHIQIYINSDQNKNTGYRGDVFKQSGAEYLIEDNRLYKFIPSSNSWSWDHIGYVSFAKDDNIVEISVAKNQIFADQDSNSFLVGAISWDEGFNEQVGNLSMHQTLTKKRSNKKIFLIGDSTVHNTTTRYGNRVEMGWGDKLGEYMVNPQNLFNLAQPGASSKSYKERNELEYDGWFNNWHQTKEIINNTNIDDGGYLFIQFGHNDETDKYYETNLKTLPGIYNSFYNELKDYIVYANDIGLTPVLITPVERMSKPTGYETELSHIKKVGDYAQTVIDLSQNEDVLLLDLQYRSWSNFNNFENSNSLMRYFAYDDNIHFSPYGAESVAYWVKELICELDDLTLCTQFK